MSRISNYFWSLYHLKPSQIMARIQRTIKNLCVSLGQFVGVYFERSVSIPVDYRRSLPAVSSRLHCERVEIEKRLFTFLNSTQILPETEQGIDSTLRRQPLLWQFHFQYHDYLLAILQRGVDGRTEAAILKFLLEWERRYPPRRRFNRESAWHPYVLSIRIEIWIRILSHHFSQRTLQEEERRILNASLYRQVRALRRNLEWGTLANHLFRNCKALIFAGVYFTTREARNWLNDGTSILDRQLKLQILTDGSHFERSPMYHVSILSDLLDVIEILDQREGEFSVGTYREVAARMLAYLISILHPDGDYPFFNDSTASISLQTEEVIARGTRILRDNPGLSTSAISEGIRKKSFAHHSGLYVHGDPDLYVAFDAGQIGPDFQPGHAHADTLSFELSWRGRRWITDTGVKHYQPGEERLYSRSTRAHNTLMVDDMEQSDIWHSFRVGRRARILFAGKYRRGEYTVFQAAHDGYARLKDSVIHERALLIAQRRHILILDWLHSRGSHQIQSSLHFHPDIELLELKDGYIGRYGDEICRISYIATSDYRSELRRTPYFPAFGITMDRSAAIATTHTTGYTLFCILIHFTGQIPTFHLDQNRKILQIQSESIETVHFSSLL